MLFTSRDNFISIVVHVTPLVFVFYGKMKETETDSELAWKTDRLTDRHRYGQGHIYIQTDRQTDRQAGRQADRQIGRQAGRQRLALWDRDRNAMRP